ncbi:MAG: thiolase family protein [Hyphomicrobiaceae bacterium]
MLPGSAYIISARRTALGRLGGLHRARRVQDLAALVIAACLKDCGLSPAKIGRLIVGNSSETGNPARLIGLTAGLPDQLAAVTIDQEEASGLTAIVDAARLVITGDAEAVIAGGAEAISMAPWQVAKPRNMHQTPRFIGLRSETSDGAESDGALEADEALARRLKISRHQQDDYAVRAHLKAGLAVDARLLPKEIVAFKATAEEGRDQSAVEPELQDLQELPPLLGEGTLTSGNTSAVHDGAAFVVVVSEAVWTELGKPPALKLLASATIGTAAAETADAPIVAMQRLLGRAGTLAAKDLDAVEMSETSAVQAIALRNALGLSDEALNGDGGAIVRGQPLGAAGAVLVARLFTRLVRAPGATPGKRGATVLGARGGIGIAALFQST